MRLDQHVLRLSVAIVRRLAGGLEGSGLVCCPDVGDDERLHGVDQLRARVSANPQEPTENTREAWPLTSSTSSARLRGPWAAWPLAPLVPLVPLEDPPMVPFMKPALMWDLFSKSCFCWGCFQRLIRIAPDPVVRVDRQEGNGCVSMRRKQKTRNCRPLWPLRRAFTE